MSEPSTESTNVETSFDEDGQATEQTVTEHVEVDKDLDSDQGDDDN